MPPLLDLLCHPDGAAILRAWAVRLVVDVIATADLPPEVDVPEHKPHHEAEELAWYAAFCDE